jgi:uncharacterized glyoxalase superfamily protein PhnB
VSDLYPFLAVRDVDTAARFYARASAATVPQAVGPVKVLEIAGPAGRARARSGAARDPVAARAVAAGATVMFPVEDQPYGLRQGRVVDPFGHHWLIADGQ